MNEMLSLFNEYGVGIEKRLRLKSCPLAVKMLKKDEDIPGGAKSPVRDFGYHLATCQALSISRREGTTIRMLKEDMWCSESVVGLGLAQPNQYFLEGHTKFPESAKNLRAGSNWAHEFPRLEAGKYIGIVSAPLATANFEPDLVIIYCDSSQLTHVLRALMWSDGHDITCRLSGHGACVYAIVPVMQNRQCQVTVPCGGDHSYAMCQDDEMIFSVPKERLEDLMSGLRFFDESGSGLFKKFALMPEPLIRESYMELGRMLGMEVPLISGMALRKEVACPPVQTPSSSYREVKK